MLNSPLILKAMYLSLFIMALISIITFIKGNNTKAPKRAKKSLKTASKKKAEGIIFGKQGAFSVAYSPTKSEGHISIFGGSGLGKTSALLIPTLRAWKGTAFVIDISGDIAKNTPTDNRLTYDVEDPYTIPFNIFGPIDAKEGEDEKNEALEKLAFLLMPDSPNLGSNGKFFNDEGRKILTASLICFYKQGYDFIQIAEMVVRSSWKELFTAIDRSQNQKAIQYINSFAGANEANTAGCKQSCDAVLKLFATNEKIKKGIRRPHPQQLAYTPSVLEQRSVYIRIEDAKLDLYAPILHIITAQTLEFLSARPNKANPTILLCLDEFASLGKMEIIGALRKLKKKNVRIMILTQALADLDLIYGTEERKAMMNNFSYKVVLGASDVDTQEYFAKLIGKEDKQQESTTQTNTSLLNPTSASITKSTYKDYIIEPSELANLGNELIVLHPEGFTKLKKNFYFK